MVHNIHKKSGLKVTDSEDTQKCQPALITLPPVQLTTLRTHFRKAYKLKEDQIELMIQSSQKSLTVTMAAAYDALQADDVCGQLVKVAHNLKGVLLNMGEKRWAELAREVEVAARNNENKDYTAAINQLADGIAEVMKYR
jgi:HPt (histidine-containing phosphotransfer) domain-containing protein